MPTLLMSWCPKLACALSKNFDQPVPMKFYMLSLPSIEFVLLTTNCHWHWTLIGIGHQQKIKSSLAFFRMILWPISESKHV